MPIDYTTTRAPSVLWQEPCPAEVQIRLPDALIDALVLAGYCALMDRSNNYRLGDAVRLALEDQLAIELRQAQQERAAAKARADSSWGNGPRRTATR
jgi:hypothetical protein